MMYSDDQNEEDEVVFQDCVTNDSMSNRRSPLDGNIAFSPFFVVTTSTTSLIPPVPNSIGKTTRYVSTSSIPGLVESNSKESQSQSNSHLNSVVNSVEKEIIEWESKSDQKTIDHSLTQRLSPGTLTGNRIELNMNPPSEAAITETNESSDQNVEIQPLSLPSMNFVSVSSSNSSSSTGETKTSEQTQSSNHTNGDLTVSSQSQSTSNKSNSMTTPTTGSSSSTNGNNLMILPGAVHYPTTTPSSQNLIQNCNTVRSTHNKSEGASPYSDDNYDDDDESPVQFDCVTINKIKFESSVSIGPDIPDVYPPLDSDGLIIDNDYNPHDNSDSLKCNLTSNPIISSSSESNSESRSVSVNYEPNYKFDCDNQQQYLLNFNNSNSNNNTLSNSNNLVSLPQPSRSPESNQSQYSIAGSCKSTSSSHNSLAWDASGRISSENQIKSKFSKTVTSQTPKSLSHTLIEGPDHTSNKKFRSLKSLYGIGPQLKSQTKNSVQTLEEKLCSMSQSQKLSNKIRKKKSLTQNQSQSQKEVSKQSGYSINDSGEKSGRKKTKKISSSSKKKEWQSESESVSKADSDAENQSQLIDEISNSEGESLDDDDTLLAFASERLTRSFGGVDVDIRTNELSRQGSLQDEQQLQYPKPSKAQTKADDYSKTQKTYEADQKTQKEDQDLAILGSNSKSTNICSDTNLLNSASDSQSIDAPRQILLSELVSFSDCPNLNMNNQLSLMNAQMNNLDLSSIGNVNDVGSLSQLDSTTSEQNLNLNQMLSLNNNDINNFQSMASEEGLDFTEKQSNNFNQNIDSNLNNTNNIRMVSASSITNLGQQGNFGQTMNSLSLIPDLNGDLLTCRSSHCDATGNFIVQLPPNVQIVDPGNLNLQTQQQMQQISGLQAQQGPVSTGTPGIETVLNNGLAKTVTPIQQVGNQNLNLNQPQQQQSQQQMAKPYYINLGNGPQKVQGNLVGTGLEQLQLLQSKSVINKTCRHWLQGKCNVINCKFRHEIQSENTAITNANANVLNNLNLNNNHINTAAVAVNVANTVPFECIPVQNQHNFQNLNLGQQSQQSQQQQSKSQGQGQAQGQCGKRNIVCRHWLQNRCNVATCRFLHTTTASETDNLNHNGTAAANFMNQIQNHNFTNGNYNFNNLILSQNLNGNQSQDLLNQAFYNNSFQNLSTRDDRFLDISPNNEIPTSTNPQYQMKLNHGHQIHGTAMNILNLNQSDGQNLLSEFKGANVNVIQIDPGTMASMMQNQQNW